MLIFPHKIVKEVWESLYIKTFLCHFTCNKLPVVRSTKGHWLIDHGAFSVTWVTWCHTTMVTRLVGCHFEVHESSNAICSQKPRKNKIKICLWVEWFCYETVYYFTVMPKQVHKSCIFNTDANMFLQVIVGHFWKVCYTVFPPNLKNICTKSTYFCKSG